MPTVTVLIGCWNNAPTLPRAIDSILGQTLTDTEVIVVDDGSTDETPEVVAGYDDPRLRRLALEHMGIARSLNRGLQEAAAPLVAFQDADDSSLPARLERQADLLAEKAEVAVAGCWMDEVDEAGRALVPRQPRDAGVVTPVLARYNPIPGTSAMLRRDAALAAGGFDPRFRFAADYDLWSRLSDHNELFEIGEVLAIRQMSSGQAGARHEREQILESIRVRLQLARRQRSASPLAHVARPFISLLTPLGLKRARRRARGMAP